MIDRMQKQHWLEAAREMGLRYVVLVSEHSPSPDSHAYVSYCGTPDQIDACFRRLRRSRSRGRTSYWPWAVLDADADWMGQLQTTAPWAATAPARARAL